MKDGDIVDLITVQLVHHPGRSPLRADVVRVIGVIGQGIRPVRQEIEPDPLGENRQGFVRQGILFEIFKELFRTEIGFGGKKGQATAWGRDFQGAFAVPIQGGFRAGKDKKKA